MVVRYILNISIIDHYIFLKEKLSMSGKRETSMVIIPEAFTNLWNVLI